MKGKESKGKDECGERLPEGKVSDAAGKAQAESKPSERQPQSVASEEGRPSAQAQPEAERQQKDEKDERFLRLLADFDNFRKRTLRERAEFQKQAVESVVVELIPVLDSMDAAIASAESSAVNRSDMAEGFSKVLTQMLTALRKFGLERVECEPGQSFDPSIHEAVMAMASDSIKEHCIIKQMRPGYRLGSKLVRAVQVVISSGEYKKPAGSPAEAKPAASEDLCG